MLRSSILVVLLISLIALPCAAATTGDPVDSNDDPNISESTMDVDAECARAEKYVHCSWCWTNCMLAIMADMWTGGDGWDGDEW